MVTAVDPLVDRFDANNNGMIERSEMIAAINAYLFGEGDAAISRADMIEVINLYLFG
jgi:Ca2+-binding EF-hand superfamily protein